MTPRKPFTEITFAQLGGSGLTPRSVRELGPGGGWMALSDLAHEAHERTSAFCPLTLPEWRALVDGTEAGLPLIVAWRDGAGTVTTATVIVTQLISLAGNTTANLYLRYWGFAHPISLRQIVSVAVPNADYSRAEHTAAEGVSA